MRRTVLNSVLNPLLGNVVNRQVREKKTHREEEAGRVETKRRRENNRGQAKSESNTVNGNRESESEMKKNREWTTNRSASCGSPSLVFLMTCSPLNGK